MSKLSKRPYTKKATKAFEPRRGTMYKNTNKTAYFWAGILPTAKSRSLAYRIIKKAVEPNEKTPSKPTKHKYSVRREDKTKLLLHRPKNSKVHFHVPLTRATKRTINEIGQRLGDFLIETFFKTPEMITIYSVYKVVKIAIATNKLIVSFEDLFEKIGHTYDFFAYSGDGNYEIKDEMKHLLTTLQASAEFVSNMRDLCHELGLVYKPYKAK